MIRGKTKLCPFGLPVPGGCTGAGGQLEDSKNSAVSYMQPIDDSMSDEESEEAMENNWELLFSIDEDRKCPFADMIFEDKESVDCKYDEASGSLPAGNVGLQGSPLYPHVHVGNMPKAQYGYPLEYYSDDNESRNVYYGLYSLIG